MCRVRFRFLGNLLSQLVHTNLTMPRWTKSRCSCMVRSRLKDLWHTGHSKGLKPVWVIMCRCRSFFSGNLLPQSCTHTYTHTQLEENPTDGNHQLSNAMHMKLYFITLHMLNWYLQQQQGMGSTIKLPFPQTPDSNSTQHKVNSGTKHAQQSLDQTFYILLVNTCNKCAASFPHQHLNYSHPMSQRWIRCRCISATYLLCTSLKLSQRKLPTVMKTPANWL